MPLDALTQSPYRNGGIVNVPVNPMEDERVVLKETAGNNPLAGSAASFLASLTQEGLQKRLDEIEREARALRVLLAAVTERDNGGKSGE